MPVLAAMTRPGPEFDPAARTSALALADQLGISTSHTTVNASVYVRCVERPARSGRGPVCDAIDLGLRAARRPVRDTESGSIPAM